MKKGNRKKWLSGMMASILAIGSNLLLPLGVVADTASYSAQSTSQVSAYETGRLAGADRYETAAKIAEDGWKSSTSYAVIAAGMDDNLVDALTAAPLAKLKNAPILLTGGTGLNEKTEAELKRLNVTNVYVTSGSGVIGQAVTDKLASMGIAVKQLGGKDRFETALNIAKEIASIQPFSQIVVTTAWANADALSVASVAAAKGMPIFLSDVNALSTDEAAYIGSLKDVITDSFIIGGTGVVSDTVKSSLPGPQRAGGADRFATNIEVLKLFGKDFKQGKIYFANGTDAHLVDALSASPLAAQTWSPVVLSGATLPAASGEYVKLNLLPKTAVALGGETVIPAASLAGLKTTTLYNTDNATLGSGDAVNPAKIKENVEITGNNVTLQNAQLDYSLYIQGSNATLKNVQVNGTVFVNPSNAGVTTFDGVTARNVVVMSGATSTAANYNVMGKARIAATATNQVVFKNSTVSGRLTVDDVSAGGSGAATAIDVQGLSSIVEAVVKAAATITTEVAQNIANVIVAPVAVQTTVNTVVELKGPFVSVTATSQATIKGDTTTQIQTLAVAPEKPNQKVAVDGVAKVDNLKVDKPAGEVESKGTTVTKTEVNASAALNASTGSFGSVNVADKAPAASSSLVAKVVVTLKGTFTQPVVVKGAADLKTDAAASGIKVEIATTIANAIVNLLGKIDSVDVKSQTQVKLGDNTTVTKITTEVKADIVVPPSATVTTLTDTGNTGTTVSGGGTVNGQPTSTEPITPPPTTPPAGGGGGGGITAVSISAVSATVGGTTVAPAAGTLNFDLSSRPDSQKVTSLNVSSGVDAPTLVISSIKVRGVEWLNSSISASVGASGTVSIGSILGGLDNNNDGISLGNLRLVFGSGDVVLTGKLTKPGYYDSSTITVTITLGTGSYTTISNEWMTISKTSAKTVQVTVEPGQGNVTLGTITNGGNFNFAQVVAAMAVGEVQYSGGVRTASQLQAAIGVATDAAFDAVRLSQLVGKTIRFGGASDNDYTVTFVQG